LPNSLDFTKLISQIDAVAANYGISIDKVSSSKVNTGNNQNGENNSDQLYESSIISFSFKSSYEKFKSFMSDLERSLRIMDIESIRLEVDDKSNIDSYIVEFETYWWPQHEK